MVLSLEIPVSAFISIMVVSSKSITPNKTFLKYKER